VLDTETETVGVGVTPLIVDDGVTLGVTVLVGVGDTTTPLEGVGVGVDVGVGDGVPENVIPLILPKSPPIDG
jgi:hypothetical protein